MSQAALSALSEYDWPGNLRELRAELDSSLARGGSLIGLSHLGPGLREQAAPPMCSAGLQDALREHERRLIERALDDNGRSVTLAAEQLKVNRVGLNRKMRAPGVHRQADCRGQSSGNAA